MSIKIERELITPKEYKSYILSNTDIINKSKVIINNSTSKAMYSFPLTERFEKKIDDYSSFFYNIPSTLNNRKAFIGYGPRSSILLSRRGKTDNYYDIPSSINPKTGSAKYTFGYSRDICRKPKCLDQRTTPGPSNYFPYEKFGQNGLKYSMSFRYKYKKEPDNYNFPGPGTYEIPSSRNLQGVKFTKTKRFDKHDWKIPGPGSYNFENLIKGNGVVYNSKFLSNNGKTIGKKLKCIKDKLITPGPGAYENFSEFQGFDRNNYVKIRKNNMSNKNKRTKSSFSSRATSAFTRRSWF